VTRAQALAVARTELGKQGRLRGLPADERRAIEELAAAVALGVAEALAALDAVVKTGGGPVARASSRHSADVAVNYTPTSSPARVAARSSSGTYARSAAPV
jgi:hypothetical protein